MVKVFNESMVQNFFVTKNIQTEYGDIKEIVKLQWAINADNLRTFKELKEMVRKFVTMKISFKKIVKTCRVMIVKELFKTIVKELFKMIVKEWMTVKNLFVIKIRMHNLDIKQCTVKLFIKKKIVKDGTWKI